MASIGEFQLPPQIIFDASRPTALTSASSPSHCRTYGSRPAHQAQDSSARKIADSGGINNLPASRTLLALAQGLVAPSQISSPVPESGTGFVNACIQCAVN